GPSAAMAPATGSTAPASPLGSGGASAASAARADEDSFLRDAPVVAEIQETAEQAAASGSKPAKGEQGGKERGTGTTGRAARRGAEGPGTKGAAARQPETQYSILLGPERFPGVRFTAVRLAFAVVAEDVQGRRSHARPILEIDPVEALNAPTDLHASGTPEGIALTWHLPAPPPPPSAPSAGAAAAASDIRGVDIYRVEFPGGGNASPSPGAPASAMAPRFPYKPIAGSPFGGGSAVDRTAGIGPSCLYGARLVSRAPGERQA